MDYVFHFQEEAVRQVAIYLLVASLVAIIVLACLPHKTQEGRYSKRAITAFVVLVSLLVALAVIATLQTKTTITLRKDIKTAIEETYGLKLDRQELRQLKYPIYGPKSEELEVYGSITDYTKGNENNLEKRTLILYSEDGKFFLGKENPTTGYTELPRVQ